MGPATCSWVLCLTLTLSAQPAVSFPQTMASLDYIYNNRCIMCPAGEFQKSCSECGACPTGSFTAELNQEDSCSSCFGDCRPIFHLKVIQNCTNKSDLKCVCEEGYTCVHKVPNSDNCRHCRKLPQTTTAGKREHAPPAISGGRKTGPEDPCSFHTCDTTPGLVTHTDTHSQTEKMTRLLPLALTCLIGGTCAALLVLVYARHGDRMCFKKAMALLTCSKGGQKASHNSKGSSHRFPRDSFILKQQLPLLFSANLGPVHVHNPGTIIVSLLSQFTGPVGPTTEGGNEAETDTGDERGCPTFQPAPSPGIHISEEETDQETDSVFFPFQEQGKDCHVSKEEVL